MSIYRSLAVLVHIFIHRYRRPISVVYGSGEIGLFQQRLTTHFPKRNHSTSPVAPLLPLSQLDRHLQNADILDAIHNFRKPQQFKHANMRPTLTRETRGQYNLLPLAFFYKLSDIRGRGGVG